MKIYGISFSKEADDDVKRIYDYYENIEAGLGSSFLRFLIMLSTGFLYRLSFNPTGYKKIYENFRILIVRKFRYKILFEFADNKIIIAEIFHQMRNPNLIYERIK